MTVGAELGVWNTGQAGARRPRGLEPADGDMRGLRTAVRQTEREVTSHAVCVSSTTAASVTPNSFLSSPPCPSLCAAPQQDRCRREDGAQDGASRSSSRGRSTSPAGQLGHLLSQHIYSKFI